MSTLALPALGDTVLVTLEAGIVRPAIVTDVQADGKISCSVFLAAGDVQKGALARFTDSTPPGGIFAGAQVEEGEAPYTWHRPKPR